MNSEHLLIEIGTEELPPKALKGLSEAFSSGLLQGLAEHNLQHGAVHNYASPRRLAVHIEALQLQAGEQAIEALGPPADRARNDDGSWSKAAAGFARKYNVDPQQLDSVDTAKGPRLAYRSVVAGDRAEDCLLPIISQSLKNLPIPKRMRWGSGRTEFVRPVHWVVLLLGDKVLEGEILGQAVGSKTCGHRFHSSGELTVDQPANYKALLLGARVMASFAERRAQVRQQVEEQARLLGAHAIIDDALLDEVTALVEWPVALTGNFEERFLQVPAEALVYSMKEHQKYFHVVDADGALLPHFITVANIESQDPAQVIDGNERVIRPRLSDADFFFRTDKKIPLQARVEQLRGVVFQQQLGSLYDKTQRTANLAAKLAAALAADTDLTRRAATLSKTDLLTHMVGEFADMQGIAGRYYAAGDGEHDDVANALEQQYWPRFSGDALPRSPVATCLALADRLDTLVGIFGIGQPPTGSRDPFALRRASLGVLRIIVEGELDLDLRDCLQLAATQYAGGVLADDTVEDVLQYMLERFRAWYEDENIPLEVFKSVAAKQLSRPLDIHRRVHAVHAFTALPEAPALAAANKRVSNILEKQASDSLSGEVSEGLLQENAEKALAQQVSAKTGVVADLLASLQYTEALASLADLQQPVDDFFDQVMVMAEREDLRQNRLRLLKALRDLFLQVADISQLAVTRQA